MGQGVTVHSLGSRDFSLDSKMGLDYFEENGALGAKILKESRKSQESFSTQEFAQKAKILFMIFGFFFS